MKNISVSTVFHKYLEGIEFDVLQKGFAGSSNLYAEYMNSFASGDINSDVAEWMCDNFQHLDSVDVECILEDHDWIIREASSVFFDAVRQLFPGENSAEWSDNFRQYAKTKFDIFGKYYFFVEQYSNAGQRLFIVQAQTEHDAFEILLDEFESFFSLDNQEEATEDDMTNSNGIYCNIDYLSLCGCVEFVKP